jgi:hypothetical protein
MPAGRSETGYRKKVPDNNKMTGRPREDASTTKEVYKGERYYLANRAERIKGRRPDEVRTRGLKEPSRGYEAKHVNYQTEEYSIVHRA